jgi:hypothetical protein
MLVFNVHSTSFPRNYSKEIEEMSSIKKMANLSKMKSGKPKTKRIL